jgi:hypothetical protein
MMIYNKYINIRLLTKLVYTFVAAFVLFLSSCSRKKTLFELLPSTKTNIHFNNKVIEDDKYNVLEYMNIYTGAGVAAGDINNDGLVDLYFSGNQTTGRLYLNKGNLQFEDITEKAGLLTNRWCTGVSMVDINQDGFLDIYVNVSGSEKFGDLANLLYINNKDNTFSEKAAEFGLAEQRLTMNASFFDYDKDGDLDVFMITNPADEMVSGVNIVKERAKKGESAGTDILYRNNGNGTFTDVSREAGILLDGYSLGCAISDVNGDSYPDIYVSNDFLSNDILYINNGNGTFTDKINEYLKHCSFASMGCDIADFNNDGLPDIYTLDMLPEDNFRRKMIIPSASYDKFLLSLDKGYTPQYTRNCLHLNNGNQSFSDIGFLSGVSSTDWSWSALFADYDNDGDKDLMVTNGFYRDLGDLDYINYQTRLQNPMGRQDAKRAEKLKAIKELANIPLQNYLFENNGNLTFTKRSEDWGFSEKGFSNGACYADLDNDGDLELILNEYNSEAKIYDNKTNELKQNNFIDIKLNGKQPNRQGIGAKIWLYTEGGQMQFQALNPYRGYESSMDFSLHFGLGKATKIDSIVIVWADGNRQIERNNFINKKLEINYLYNKSIENTPLSIATIFTDFSEKVTYKHEENAFSDFKLQPLLPHLHSQNAPCIAVGDINGDGLEDFFIGAASGSKGSFFIQNKSSEFSPKPLSEISLSDDMGVLLFDFDGDKDLDLYIVGGGSEFSEGANEYQDRLFENDGKGNFKRLDHILPDTRGSGSCVVPCDFDKDGDLDLFIGGRVAAGRYPMSPRSYLLKNQGGKFIDDTPQYLQNVGMVTAANWADIDKNGWDDLILVGEFMPFTVFNNENGLLQKGFEVHNSNGWWHSLAYADFDNDGDIDFIAGNLGLNSRYKATEKQPVCIYAKDYDKNGRIDPIMCHYVLGENVIAHTRDEMIKQINPMRGRFKSYKAFASANFSQSFTKDEIQDAFFVKANCFETSYFENKGHGQFTRHPLSIETQFAPINSILIQDFDKDGFLDALIAGNDYATEASTGRYDAMTGLLLKGNGKGNFMPLKSKQTGFKADKDVKYLASINLHNSKKAILVANNHAKMEFYIYK